MNFVKELRKYWEDRTIGGREEERKEGIKSSREENETVVDRKRRDAEERRKLVDEEGKNIERKVKSKSDNQ